jgi:hypothetical protein
MKTWSRPQISSQPCGSPPADRPPVEPPQGPPSAAAEASAGAVMADQSCSTLAATRCWSRALMRWALGPLVLKDDDAQAASSAMTW